MPNMFTLDNLAESEIETQKQTLIKFGDIQMSFREIINTFLKLQYFFGDLEKPETDRGYYQAMAATHYCQAPYSFWILNNLYRTGYYLEATILYRHLIEAFIQIRYFDKCPEKTERQLQRKNFREMFDEFSPGFYTKYYSLLCDAAHGVLFKDLCRFDRKQGRIRMGCELNLIIADYLVNGIIVLLYVYLNKYGTVFPKNTVRSESSVQQALADAKQWLLGIMKNHREEFPKSREWYTHIDKFVK